MFYGEYCHAIDKKGRIIIPAKFREILREFNKNEFIITRGLEKSLFIFSLKEWETQKEKFELSPLHKAKSRAFSRILFSSAYWCSLDRQGRIRLPQTLIEYAVIEKEVIIVGISNRIELWNKNRWKEYIGKIEFSYREVAKDIIESGNFGRVETG